MIHQNYIYTGSAWCFFFSLDKNKFKILLDETLQNHPFHTDLQEGQSCSIPLSLHLEIQWTKYGSLVNPQAQIVSVREEIQTNLTSLVRQSNSDTLAGRSEIEECMTVLTPPTDWMKSLEECMTVPSSHRSCYLEAAASWLSGALWPLFQFLLLLRLVTEPCPPSTPSCPLTSSSLLYELCLPQFIHWGRDTGV